MLSRAGAAFAALVDASGVLIALRDVFVGVEIDKVCFADDCAVNVIIN